MTSIDTLYQFWIHTELIDRLGPLEWVFNTPSHHRVHHGANVEYLDRNYAGILILWDRWFGSFEPERAPVRFGLTKNIGSYNPVYAAFHEFVAVFRVLELFILLLALLIAYNAASINTDERRRDHATLFAFGLPIRRVLRMDLIEGLLLGLLGTTAGIAAGRAILGWVTTELMGNTMPELGLERSHLYKKMKALGIRREGGEKA